MHMCYTYTYPSAFSGLYAHTSGSHLPAGRSVFVSGKQVRFEHECVSHAVVTCMATLPFPALLPISW